MVLEKEKRKYCAFFLKGRCYSNKRIKQLDEFSNYDISKGGFCYGDGRAKLCEYFKPQNKKVTEAALQQKLF